MLPSFVFCSNSAEQVQEPHRDEALCDNCEELKAVLTIMAKYSMLTMAGFMYLSLIINNSDY